MIKYEQIDISGDTGLRIRGKTIVELFENAGIGMYTLITDTSKIKKTAKKEITLSSDSSENLLVQWLNELIYQFDAHNFIGTAFFIELKDYQLNAHVSGGLFDQKTNESRLLLKAATYNSLSVKKTASGWEAMVVFDI